MLLIQPTAMCGRAPDHQCPSCRRLLKPFRAPPSWKMSPERSTCGFRTVETARRPTESDMPRANREATGRSTSTARQCTLATGGTLPWSSIRSSSITQATGSCSTTVTTSAEPVSGWPHGPMTEWHRTSGQLVRYALVGVAINVLGYAVYLGITHIGADPKVTMSFLYGTATIASFLANRRVT